MKGTILLIRDIIVNPQRALVVIREERPYFLVFIIFLVNIISSVTAQCMLASYGFTPDMLFVVFLSNFMLGITYFFILAGIFHLFAELLNGRGSSTALFCLFLVAHMPWVFLTSAAIIFGGITLANNFIFYLVKLLIFIWVVFLMVKAVQINYNFSLAKTFLLFGIFIFLVMFLIIFFFAASISMVMMALFH